MLRIANRSEDNTWFFIHVLFLCVGHCFIHFLWLFPLVNWVSRLEAQVVLCLLSLLIQLSFLFWQTGWGVYGRRGCRFLHPPWGELHPPWGVHPGPNGGVCIANLLQDAFDCLAGILPPYLIALRQRLLAQFLEQKRLQCCKYIKWEVIGVNWAWLLPHF